MKSGLFSSLELGRHVIRNRIVMPPMCMYAAAKDGRVIPFHVIHYGARALGGSGVLITEATAVEPVGRITDGDLGLWSDGQIAGHQLIVGAVRDGGALPILQIAHAGRKSQVPDALPVAPSALPFSEDDRTPIAMGEERIEEAIAAFVTTAERAMRAGYAGVEVHAAHGYLLNSFLSPLTNQREDRWADPTEVLSRVVRGVRKAIGKEALLFLRVSAEEYHAGGNHPEDIAAIVNQVKDLGLDVIHVSSGGVVDVAPPSYPGYQVAFAETIKKKTGLPTIAGGLITTAELADEIIQNGRADMVYLGRELLRHPQFPLEAAKKLRQEIPVPKPYERAYR